jgi:hypothetical protein
MKLSEFILLNEEQKKGTLLHEGILVAKRHHIGRMVFLFQLENYYVESYCNVNDHSISEFRVLLDNEPPAVYLENISLDDLLN